MFLPLAAFATVYHVDPAGSDTSAGTADHPFKTIAHAADIVEAGDTVLINPGTYTKGVEVKHTGTREQPIVFQSVKRHGAVMTHQFSEPNFNPGGQGGPIRYITVKGIQFRSDDKTYQTGDVTASVGWRYEDCLIHGFGSGLCARGGETSVVRCIFEDIGGNGLTFAEGKNWEVTDCIFRRCDQTAYSPGGYVGACKILLTQNTRVDGLISYDNYGSGWWLDWDNTYFSITNSTIFGNHAGQAHEVIGGHDLTFYQSWAAPGIWSEGNPGPALIENNVFYSNMCPAIGILEGSNHIIRNNLIVDCGDGIDLRAQTRDGIKNLGKSGPNVITNNRFKWWRGAAVSTLLPTTIKDVKKPAIAGQFIDNNIYDPGPSDKLIRWVKQDAASLREARTKFGAEANGTMAHIPFTPELIPIHRLMLDETKDPVKMRQVPSGNAEALSIDGAIADAHAGVGDEVVIPVFGRKAIDMADKKPSQTVVYDLQGRYVPLTIESGDVTKALAEGVTQFAFLKPAYLKVKLTKLEEYDIQASAVGLVSVPNLPDNPNPPASRDFTHPVGIRDGIGKAKAGDTVVISFLSRTDIGDDPQGGKTCDILDYEHTRVTLHLRNEAEVKLIEPITIWETGPYYMRARLTEVGKDKIAAIPLDFLE